MRLYVIFNLMLASCCMCKQQTVKAQGPNDLAERYESIYKQLFEERLEPGALTDHSNENSFSMMAHGFIHSSGTSQIADLRAQANIELTRQLIREGNPSNFELPSMYCPFKGQIQCDPNEPYRRYDGSCNNLDFPWWGQADMPYKRWLRPAYSDPEQLSEPRKSVDGLELPLPRDISCLIHTDNPSEVEPNFSHMLMQYGQFINHDVTMLAISKDPFGNDYDCSDCRTDFVCRPIPYYTMLTCGLCGARMKRSCMEFIRSSATYSDPSCRGGPREQHNIQTSFVDASHIYGNNEEEAQKLRDKNAGRGLLLTQKRGSKKEFLPREQMGSQCLDHTPLKSCPFAADTRATQNPSLLSMHTIFVREHNRIARVLSTLNPNWNDETVYQETRRIVIASVQHISYWEWLPIIIGPRLMQKFQLHPVQNGYFSGYDKTKDARTTNEWATAVQRFGHSMVKGKYMRADKYYNIKSEMNLNSMFFRANHIYDDEKGGLDSIVRGLLKDTVSKVDAHISDDLTKHLFETFDSKGRPSYFDLMAINIQRGRDHGLPGYPKFREWLGLPPVRSWDEMKMFMPGDVVDKFASLYRYVEDVDLISAGLAEFKERGALVGPTFAEMIAMMFHDWKVGDRYWYENDNAPVRFTPEQLGELQKVSLARVLCNNLDDTPMIQPNAFLTPDIPGNEPVDCRLLRDLNLVFWKAN